MRSVYIARLPTVFFTRDTAHQVVRNLLKSENLQVREQLIKARARTIKITEERMCPVCNKRLGESRLCSLFFL